jgi:hypothetical protein
MGQTTGRLAHPQLGQQTQCSVVDRLHLSLGQRLTSPADLPRWTGIDGRRCGTLCQRTGPCDAACGHSRQDITRRASAGAGPDAATFVSGKLPRSDRLNLYVMRTFAKTPDRKMVWRFSGLISGQRARHCAINPKLQSVPSRPGLGRAGLGIAALEDHHPAMAITAVNTFGPIAHGFPIALFQIDPGAGVNRRKRQL